MASLILNVADNETRKRAMEGCDPQSNTLAPPLKKAKIEQSEDFVFTFYKEHFLTAVPGSQHVMASFQNSPLPKHVGGVPYWVSDPRFVGGNTPNVVERKEPSSDSEEVNDVMSEVSEVSEDSIFQATPIMAEVVDMVWPSSFETTAVAGGLEDIHPTMLRKLSASKSPIMEALIYCAFNAWGVQIVKQDSKGEWVPDTDFGLTTKDGSIAFKFFDFDLLSSCLERVNSKNKPTTDPGARIKALKRWFDGIPCVRDRNERFIATVKKTEQLEKVNDMIRRMLRIYKRRLESTKSRNGDAPIENESQESHSGSEG